MFVWGQFCFSSAFLAVLLLCAQVQFTYSDILFSEGFFDYDNLPGGYNDSLNRPNVPLSTQTNRFADGITSTGAYDSSSPRFPVYEGFSANFSDRYLRYTEYIKSAAEQGIAEYGAGDRVREEARLRITSQPNFRDLPAPNKTFPVYASIKWNPSDFAIQEGETYNITVLGNQTGYSDQFWFDGGLRVNAEGYASYFDAVSNCYVGMGRCRPQLKKKRRLPTANWMSLACAIGQFVRPLGEIEPGNEERYRWMPLDESTLVETIFDVGLSVQFRAIYTGQLICFANDAHSLYWNNYGSIDVTVTRASWPPSSEEVYEPFTLPACDSARVVYSYISDPNNTALGVYDPLSRYVSDVIKCNPTGGGTGWRVEDILRTDGGYSSGAPDELYYDNPDYIQL